MATKKRILKNIDFSADNSHIALTSKEANGGPANGADYALVLKSKSTEFIEKVQQIQVTMELPDFLRKFFGLYYEDAEVLARVFGYVEEEKEQDDWNYEDYLQEQVSSFTIMKSLRESENIHKAISDLQDEEFLQLRKDQQLIEGLFAKVEKAKATGVSSIAKTKQKEIQMTNQVEMIEKSQLVEIQKQFAETQELLKAAKEQLATFEAEKKETIRKAKLQTVEKAVGDKAVAEVLFKAVGLVEDQTEFEAIVKALEDMKALVEKSAAFEEVGASAQESAPAVEESGVTKILKSQFASK